MNMIATLPQALVTQHPSLEKIVDSDTGIKPNDGGKKLDNAGSKKLDNAGSKKLDNAGYIQHTNKKTLDAGEVNHNNRTLASQAENNNVGLDKRNPDLTLPLVEADSSLLDKQIAQLRSTMSSVPPSEARQLQDNIAQEFSVQAEKAKVDIVSIANGFTGRAANILQIVIETALEARKSTASEREATRQVAFAQGQHAADQKIQAGVDGRNNAITQGAVGAGMALAGGGVSLNGLKKSSNAQMTHGTQALNQKRTADNLSGQLAPSKSLNVNDVQSQSDVSILKRTADRHYNNAQQEQLHLSMAENRAQRWQVAGNLTSANAMNTATIVSAQGQVTQAESLANEQRAIIDKEMFNSRSEADNRMAEEQAQFKSELLQLLTKMQEGRSSAIGSMTQNLRG